MSSATFSSEKVLSLSTGTPLFSSSLLSSLKLSDPQVYAPSIRAPLGTTAHFCEAVDVSVKWLSLQYEPASGPAQPHRGEYLRKMLGVSIYSTNRTRCCFTMTNMIQVCSNFQRARGFIIDTRLDEIKREPHSSPRGHAHS
jgi:hypothetical protein